MKSNACLFNPLMPSVWFFALDVNTDIAGECTKQYSYDSFKTSLL